MPTLLQSVLAEYGTENAEFALVRLRAMGRHAVPALLASLRSEDATERLWAIKLLGETGDVRAVPPLIDLLNTLSATSAVSRGSSMRQALQLAKGEWGQTQTRRYCVQALTRFNDTRATDALLTLLDDPDATVRGLVARAFARQESSPVPATEPVPKEIVALSTPTPTPTLPPLTDDEFLTQFEECTLPRAHWTHENHLRMAYLYLRRAPNAEAVLPFVRERIQAYNHANGAYKGYHETITVAYLRIVADRLRRGSYPSFASFRTDNAGIFQSTYLLRHYSEAALFAEEARRVFVLPDREPLPL
jgi:hypothetical protein